MTVVIPLFRSPGADYVFVVDALGCIVGVHYPSGDSFLHATEHD